MRLLIAGLVGALVGIIQLSLILIIETAHDTGRSGLLASDTVFPIFVLLVLVEILCVIALAMYRVSPWVSRFLRDPLEADRITEGRKRYGVILQRTTVVATAARRIIVAVDAGEFSWDIAVSWGIALSPLLIPCPRRKK